MHPFVAFFLALDYLALFPCAEGLPLLPASGRGQVVTARLGTHHAAASGHKVRPAHPAAAASASPVTTDLFQGFLTLPAVRNKSRIKNALFIVDA